MNTLKNIGIALAGTMVFALALRTGYQAERENRMMHKAFARM